MPSKLLSAKLHGNCNNCSTLGIWHTCQKQITDRRAKVLNWVLLLQFHNKLIGANFLVSFTWNAKNGPNEHMYLTCCINHLQAFAASTIFKPLTLSNHLHLWILLPQAAQEASRQSEQNLECICLSSASSESSGQVAQWTSWQTHRTTECLM